MRKRAAQDIQLCYIIILEVFIDTAVPASSANAVVVESLEYNIQMTANSASCAAIRCHIPKLCQMLSQS